MQNGDVKSLRMMSDKASVFDTVSIQILSLALEFVAPRRQSLSSNWVFLRDSRAPTVKLACVTVPRSPMEGAKIIDEVICIPYLSFFSSSLLSSIKKVTNFCLLAYDLEFMDCFHLNRW